jgi:transcriptional regulator GlxA family with amidase domain
MNLLWLGLWLGHLRLQEARALLITQRDVITVAHLVGYTSPTQFNREYRRQFGLPPGRHAAQWRVGGMGRLP